MSEATPKARPRRGANILLIVSLCLNVVLVPVMAAVVVRAMHRASEIGSGGILAPRSVMAAIPAEQSHIQKIIDARTQKIRALRADSLRSRVDAFAALAAPDYSADKFVAALDRVAVADGALERESIAMMAQSLATLTPPERQAMVDKVKKRNRSWFWRMFRPNTARQ
jgi:uncharacterized membrane protein